MHVLEIERLLDQFGKIADSAEAPGGNVRGLPIVSPGLAFGCLALLAEVASAGLVAFERVEAHQLGELEEIGHAACLLERLVEFLAVAENFDVVPELLAQVRDLSESELQALC